MRARDAAMSLEEFRRYYRKNKRRVRSAKAYDSAGRRWIEGEDIFRRPGAYTLIVLQLDDGSFLRLDVRPSLKIAYAPGKYASAGTWARLGVYLTYGEKEFLESLGEDALSPDELIAIVEASAFEGREGLAKKLKKAVDAMQR